MENLTVIAVATGNVTPRLSIEQASKLANISKAEIATFCRRFGEAFNTGYLVVTESRRVAYVNGSNHAETYH